MSSRLHPNLAAHDARNVGPSGVSDQALARTLAADLERVEDDHTPPPWGAIWSGVVAFFSLGTVPALLWHDRFRDFVDVERQKLRRFAEWLRLHSSRPDTMDLRVAGEELGCRSLLSGLSVLSVLGLVVLFALHLSDAGSRLPIVEQVLSLTYEFRPDRPWTPSLSDRQTLFVAWSVALGVAYLFHWIQIQAHAADVRRFVRHANRVLAASGVERVPLPRAGLRLGVLWLAGAVFLASKGAWWGVALALTGASQQHYMRHEARRLQLVLAARVREMAGLPPAEAAEAASAKCATAAKRCGEVRCLAPLPAGARFCPRCGHAVVHAADSV